MIKLIAANYQGDFQATLRFSDGKEGIFDGRSLLQRSGPLLEPLQDEAYFKPCSSMLVPCAGPMDWNFPLHGYMILAGHWCWLDQPHLTLYLNI